MPPMQARCAARCSCLCCLRPSSSVRPEPLSHLSTSPQGARRPVTRPVCRSSPAGSSHTPNTRWASATAGVGRHPGRASTARASCSRPTARSAGSSRARAGISCAWAGWFARAPRPGDLLFTEGGGHVQLVVSKRKAISAPQTGERVRAPCRWRSSSRSSAGARRVLG